MNGSELSYANSSTRSDPSRVQSYHLSLFAVAMPAFLANLLLCVFHCRCKRLRPRIHNVFAVSHYVANVLQTTSVVASYAKPEFDEYLTFILNLSFCSSVFSLTVTSFVRLSKTLWFSYYTRFFSRNLPYVTLGIVWILSLGLTTPGFWKWGAPLLFLRYPVHVSLSYALFFWTVTFVLPLIAMCFNNQKLFRRVVKKRDIEFQNPRAAGKSEPKWMVSLETALLALCLAPVAVETTVFSVVSQKNVAAFRYIFNCVALAHCLFSPVLHLCTNKELRQKMACCHKGSFVLQGRRSKKKRQAGHVQISCGQFRLDRGQEAFFLHEQRDTCNGQVQGEEWDRFVRFVGPLTESSSLGCHGNNPLQECKTRQHGPMTAEVSPTRRDSTRQAPDEMAKPVPEQQSSESVGVRFDVSYAEKQRKKYIQTPSLQRMRRINREMNLISLMDLQSRLTNPELENQPHVALRGQGNLL